MPGLLPVVQQGVRGPRPGPGLRTEVSRLSPGVGGGGGDLVVRGQDTGPVTLARHGVSHRHPVVAGGRLCPHPRLLVGQQLAVDPQLGGEAVPGPGGGGHLLQHPRHVLLVLPQGQVQLSDLGPTSP